jgi:nitrilase
VLYADIELERVGQARRTLDVVGHYSRPDIFRLHVSARPLRPVEFESLRDQEADHGIHSR